jgi:hypothetical protein
MTFESFLLLHDKIGNLIEFYAKQHIYLGRKKKRSGRQVRRGIVPPPPPNGSIVSSTRLGCALRYFAGGDSTDIMVNYGIGYTDVLVSVWSVVMALNRSPNFYICYPNLEIKQKEIAQEFFNASSVGFDNCAGAIDGLLIWTHMPSSNDKGAGDDIGRKSFLCARKNKFGLNMQAVSDCRGRFLDMSIKCGGASSDCLAFEASRLHHRLERGLLAHGLVLFGDNAYINTHFMATPFTNVSSGSKDDYNFYHSQLRIRIECAFGMFVKRWGILRTAIPQRITIQKTVAMVNALAKLHNFCIDCVDRTRFVEESTSEDLCNIVISSDLGHVMLEDVDGCDVQLPLQIMDPGHHFDDIPETQRRCQPRDEVMPRTKLLLIVVESSKHRPPINRRK